VDFLKYWNDRTEIAISTLIKFLDMARSKFYSWIERYGMENNHNGQMPRDFWLLPEEKKAIVEFYGQNPLNGYRRLSFMMIDRDIVCVSPKTVYRVLKAEGVLNSQNTKTSSKGGGFNQPTAAHKHWHVDISYINICGTFYYMCSILDGYSRYIVNWDIRESMKEEEIELIIQKALELYPDESPRVISDNGPQFVSRDFKAFIKLAGMDHVRTSPYYPQSNGKIERYHREIKQDCIRAKVISSLEQAKKEVTDFVDHYNNHRLHSAIDYITPADKLEGNEDRIFKLRDQRLETARLRRKLKWHEMLAIEKESVGGYGSAEEQPERHTDRGKLIIDAGVA